MLAKKFFIAVQLFNKCNAISDRHKKEILTHIGSFILFFHSLSPGAAVASVRPAASSRSSPPLRTATPVGATPSPGSVAARSEVLVRATYCRGGGGVPSDLSRPSSQLLKRCQIQDGLFKARSSLGFLDGL
jgi:hypothetical protein